MGSKRDIKLIWLCIMFLVASVFVYWNIEPASNSDQRVTQQLSSYLRNIKGYELIRQIDLADDAKRMLNLDDYFFADYAGKIGKVNLYVGYYYSMDKAYASHSPTICYPSQGWDIISKPTTHTYDVGQHKIRYEEITASINGERQLVLYWYQSGLLTSTSVYLNKLSMGYNKIVHGDEKYAFVRVSVALHNSAYDVARVNALDFIRAFYPKFIHVNESGT